MIHYDPAERGFGELFAYASCHWIDHFGAISTETLLPRLSDIELLCRAGSTRLHNWIAQNCRPDCAIRARFVFDSTLYDPLGITSLYGPDIMLLRMLEHSDFGEDAFLRNPVMQAADQILQWGDLSRLKLLWGSRIGHQIHNREFFQLVLEQWSRSTSNKCRDGWGAVFSLLDDVHDAMSEEGWGSTVLSKAASVGCMPVVRRLFDAAQHHVQLRDELLDISQCENGLIGTAVLGNHVDVVEYLLGQQGVEPHLQHQNACGENVLHLASRICNPEIFQLLVPRLKDNVYQRDKQGDTVFTRIVMSSSASRDRCEAARILIAEVGNCEHGQFFDEQQAALRAAMSLGDWEMRRLFQ